jgi:hypothetical protein
MQAKAQTSTITSVSLSSSLIDFDQSVTITATVNASAATGNATFGFSTDNGTSWSTLGSSPISAGIANYSYTPKVTGSTFEFNATYNGDPNYFNSTSSTPVSLTVDSAPSISVEPSSATIDSGQSVTLSSTVTGGTGSFLWQWYDYNGSISGTSGTGVTATRAFSAADTGIYVIFTDTGTGSATPTATATSSPTVAVTVNSAPSISVEPSSATIDSGQSVTLSSTVTGGTGSFLWQWYDDSGLISDASGTGVTATYTTSAADTGIYVTFTDTGTGSATPTATATSSPTVAVTVDSALVAPTVTSTPGTVDQGQTSSLTSSSVTTGTPSYTYVWFEKAPGGSYASVGSNSGSFSFVTSSSTATGSWSFILQVTDSTGAAVNSTAVSVMVNLALVASTVTSTPGTVDQGQTSSLTSSAVSSGTSPYTYQWLEKAPGGSFSPISGAASASYSFVASRSTATGTWSFELQVTDAAGAQVTSTAAAVAVNAAPSVTVSPSSWTMDSDQFKTFSATPSGGSESYTGYQWYVDGSAQSGQTASTFSFAPVSSGSYSITVTVTDNLGATSAQSSAAIVTVNVAGATYFEVSGFPSTTTAGVVHTVTVTIYNGDGNVATNYAGTVAITSSDSKAVLPASAVLIDGVGFFSVTLVTAGSQSITATDTSDSSITGSETGIKVTHAAAAANVVITPADSSVTAGATKTYSATATDAYGNTWDVTSSTTWSISSGAGGSWSSNVYTSAIAGSWTVTGTYASTPYTTGLTVNPIITASAGANGSINPSGSVSVNYGGSQTFTITANTGYYIVDVLVNGRSVGAVNSYTFTNVQAAYTISATFAPTATSTSTQTSTPSPSPTATPVPISTPTPISTSFPTPTPFSTKPLASEPSFELVLIVATTAAEIIIIFTVIAVVRIRRNPNETQAMENS